MGIKRNQITIYIDDILLKELKAIRNKERKSFNIIINEILNKSLTPSGTSIEPTNLQDRVNVLEIKVNKLQEQVNKLSNVKVMYELTKKEGGKDKKEQVTNDMDNIDEQSNNVSIDEMLMHGGKKKLLIKILTKKGGLERLSTIDKKLPFKNIFSFAELSSVLKDKFHIDISEKEIVDICDEQKYLKK